MFVARIAALRDHPFPALAGGTLPRVHFVVERRHMVERRPQRQPMQDGAPLVERQRTEIASVQPRDIEHVIVNAGSPGSLPVQNDILNRQLRQRVCDRRQVLEQPVSREQPDIRSLLERQQPDAVELAFEDPLGSGKTLLGRTEC